MIGYLEFSRSRSNIQGKETFSMNDEIMMCCANGDGINDTRSRRVFTLGINYKATDIYVWMIALFSIFFFLFHHSVVACVSKEIRHSCRAKKAQHPTGIFIISSALSTRDNLGLCVCPVFFLFSNCFPGVAAVVADPFPMPSFFRPVCQKFDYAKQIRKNRENHPL